MSVEILGWKRVLDARPVLALHGVIRAFEPQVIHAWSRKALRSLAVSGTGGAQRLFYSDLLKPGHPLAFWDRMLVRNAAAVVAFSADEAARYRRNGVAARSLVTVPPGVESPCAEAVEPPVPNGRFMLGVGPLEMHKGFRDAVWALDILHYLYPDLHLVLAGDGGDRVRIGQFAHAVGATVRVHFLGPVSDPVPLMKRAAVVWVPSREQGGMCVALEAMAAARPVVGTRTGGLDEIIEDGVTGFLVKPGDKADLARQTRRLLDDPALAERLGEAGRHRVLEHFSAARMVRECAQLYDSVQ